MERKEEIPLILSQRSARTLTNVADALGIEDPARLAALAPAAEAWLRHRGVGAARRAWLALAWIEWRPVLGLASRLPFSRCSRERRAAWLAGRSLATVRAMIDASAVAAHSSPGA